MDKNKNLFKFILFSILGIILFLVPLNLGGNSKIFISHFVDFILNNFYSFFIICTEIIAILVILCTILFYFYTSKSATLNNIFKTTPINIFARIFGSFLYLLVLNRWFSNNPIASAFLDSSTGGTMAGADGLLTTLYLTFFIGILILPLLTHFGSVEYIGTLVAPFVEKTFRVPGYSAIDAIASFVGDGTIGIVVTDTQYKRGYYTKREAYIIATSFSIVGIAFAASVAEKLGFGSIFPLFYFSIAVTTIIIAFITARLKLKKYPDEYYKNIQPKKINKPENKTTHQHALDLALEQVSTVKFDELVKNTFINIINIYVGFLPVIMLVGTTCLVLAEKTSLFSILSAPLVPFYSLLGFSEEVSKMMAPATMVGFADMYLPAIFIGESPSEISRFFIGVLSFTQLLFMSETGMVLLKSSLGVNFFDIIKIFLFRTILSIPIVLCITYFFNFIGLIS